MRKKTIWIAVLTVLIALIWYWTGDRQSKKPGAGKQQVVTVSIVPARVEDYPITLETNGSVMALNQVSVHPQINGLISKVHIEEGQFVKAGQLLFTLDAKAAQVGLARAQAQLRRDQASLADYERQLSRGRDLLQQNFISRSAVDTLQSQAEAQRALVAAGRSAVDAARVELGYTRISASGSGRAGEIKVHPGSYVQPGGEPLVTIMQVDPIAVSFTLPQQYLQSVLARMQGGKAKVSVQLPEQGRSMQGTIRFVDNAVDQQTGTVQVKAQFDNANSHLWPGAFVAVTAEVGHIEEAVVIPAAAVIKSARGDLIYLAQGGKASQRAIQVLHSARDTAVVQGVAAGEAVIVNGKQNLKPGAAIQIEGRPGKNKTEQAGQA